MNGLVIAINPRINVSITVSGKLQHLCPWRRDEVDVGAVTITWRTRGATFELHALRAYLEDEFADMVAPHEDVTEQIRRDLADLDPGIEVLSVRTTWETGGLAVECTTSQTPAVTPTS